MPRTSSVTVTRTLLEFSGHTDFVVISLGPVYIYWNATLTDREAREQSRNILLSGSKMPFELPRCVSVIFQIILSCQSLVVIIGPQACPRRPRVLRFGVASWPAWSVSTPVGNSSSPRYFSPSPPLRSINLSPYLCCYNCFLSLHHVSILLSHSPFVRSSLASHPVR